MQVPEDELTKLKMGKTREPPLSRVPSKIPSTGMLMRMVNDESRGDSYCMVIWYAASIGVSHTLLGAVIVSIMIYSFHFGSPHAAIYTIAYHFFSAEAILTLSYVNGWSTPMRWKHRKYVHALLQICAIVCSVLGTIGIVRDRANIRSFHGVTGVLTLVLTGATLVAGPFALTKIRRATLVHMSFGTPCFLASSLCLCSGLFKDEFRIWAGRTVFLILFVFVLFYSCLICITTSIKFLQRL